MNKSDERRAILAQLSCGETKLVRMAWERADTVAWLARHRKVTLLRHFWRHPSLAWHLLEFAWTNWRLTRRLRQRLQGAPLRPEKDRAGITRS